jgi:methyltransferase (TIGR00027 family)
MRERRPSQTASFVALARALAHDGFTSLPGFDDPYALALLSPRWRSAYSLISRWMRRARPERRQRAIAQLDVIPLRVAAIDAELRAAVGDGARQLVILGAGLDTRAFRMPDLGDVAVFEVDHPATQTYKRRRSSSLPVVAKSLTFVPVDFERGGSLSAALGEAGLRARDRTAWIWEGVVMYLTDEALGRTVDEIARCSSPSSTLIVQYHEPSAPVVNGHHGVRRLLLTLWREPQLGLRPPEVMHSQVRRVGFDVVSDTRPSDWAHRLGARAPSGHNAAITHLLVARRPAAGRA